MCNDKAYIICQAPVEVPNVLSLYEQCKKSYNEIFIVSSRTDSYSKFFQLLNVDAKFIKWDFNEFDFLKNWNLKTFHQQIVDNLQNLDLRNSDVFYTSRLDFFVLCHLQRFPIGTRFFYRGLMDDVVWKIGRVQGKGIKQRIRENIIKWRQERICHRKLYFYNCNSISILGFSPQECNHQIMQKFNDSKRILERYKFTPKSNNKKVAILYTEPYRNAFHSKEDYIKMNHKIVEELHKRNYYVIMKGHPRIGICEEIKDKVDEIIPQYVPAEFIDLKDFSLAIGFVSTALASASECIPTYSVLDMCEITNLELVTYWKKYLFNVAGNKIVYLKSFEDI